MNFQKLRHFDSVPCLSLTPSLCLLSASSLCFCLLSFYLHHFVYCLLPLCASASCLSYSITLSIVYFLFVLLPPVFLTPSICLFSTSSLCFCLLSFYLHHFVCCLLPLCASASCLSISTTLSVVYFLSLLLPPVFLTQSLCLLSTSSLCFCLLSF